MGGEAAVNEVRVSYSASYLMHRDGYRGHLSYAHGADPAKPWWWCPHSHPTAEEAVQCAEAEAAARLSEPVLLGECMRELAHRLGMDIQGGEGDRAQPSREHETQVLHVPA